MNSDAAHFTSGVPAAASVELQRTLAVVCSDGLEPRTPRAVRELTDLDLAPVRRSEGNYWKAKYFEAMHELTKLNKGVRRLQRKVKRLEARQSGSNEKSTGKSRL